MDRAGNAGSGVAVTGRYFSMDEWHALIEAAGGHVARLVWPLDIHGAPWRWLIRSELQMAAMVEHV